MMDGVCLILVWTYNDITPVNVILWDNSCLDDVNWDTIMDDHARVSEITRWLCIQHGPGFSGCLGYPGGSLLGCGLRIGVNAKSIL